jgi:hypothetical protein
MLNYGFGKIYIITNTVNSIIYIGSTAQEKLFTRMAQHRKDAVREGGSPLHRAMLSIGIKKFKISLHLAYPCTSKHELHEVEFHTTNCALTFGYTLYNTMLNGKHSAESKARISAHSVGNRGRKCSDVTKARMQAAAYARVESYGCLKLENNKGPKQWVFAYRRNGITTKRSFAVNKYGAFEAKAMAEEARRRVFPNYIAEQ